MTVAVTRAYLRGRLLVMLAGILLAVGTGAVVIHYLAEESKTSVKFSAVISHMGDATSDVIHHALRLDNTRIFSAQNSIQWQQLERGEDGMLRPAPMQRALNDQTLRVIDEVRADLARAIERLESERSRAEAEAALKIERAEAQVEAAEDAKASAEIATPAPAPAPDVPKAPEPQVAAPTEADTPEPPETTDA